MLKFLWQDSRTQFDVLASCFALLAVAMTGLRLFKQLKFSTTAFNIYLGPGTVIRLAINKSPFIFHENFENQTPNLKF